MSERHRVPEIPERPARSHDVKVPTWLVPVLASIGVVFLGAVVTRHSLP
jgi:hypothetical protein